MTNKRDKKGSVSESGDEFKEIFNKSPIGILFHDKEGNLINANKSALDIMGIPKLEDFMGFNLFLNPHIRNKKEELFKEGSINFQALLNLGLMKNFGFYNPTKKGIIFLNYMISITDFGYLVQIQDITERKEAENSLVNGEEKYRHLIETANSIILHWKPDGIITFMNSYGLRFFGYKEEELIGKHIDILLPSVDSSGKNLKELIPDIVGSPHLYEINENENMRRDGSRAWIAWTNKVILKKGQPNEVLSVGNDITKHKEADERLRKKRELLQAIIDTIPVMITIYDPKLQIIQFNRNFREVLGWSEEDVKHKDFMSLFYPDPEYRKMVQEYMQSLNSGWKDFKVTTKEGSTVDSSWANVRIPDGRQVGIGIDIRERKIMEEELKQARDNLELKVRERTAELKYQGDLLKNVNDAITATDQNYLITSWNPAAERLYGWNANEVIGKNVFEILQIEFIGKNRQEMIEFIAKSEGYKGEEIHRHKNGSAIYVESTVMALKDQKNNICGWVAVNRDITERKQVEKEVSNLITDLKRSNEELEHFAYVASHDLQEPLRTIASFTQLLKRRYENKLDSDADEFMNYIVDAAVRMKEQIEGLLEYSRVATKGKEFELVDLNKILNITLQSINTSIKESSAEIAVEELPNVMGDAGQLQRVFQNLISNAIRFRKCEETLKIHISHYKDIDKNEYVFSIEDNGIGIEEQYMERIFTIFQRLHTRDEYKGTGIGLSIVKMIIERHGGRVWVESELDKGSTFYFTIPFTH